MADGALIALLQTLDARQYDFVTPGPATHRRNLRRRGDSVAGSIRDVFGWSLPFSPDLLPSDLFHLLLAGDGVVEEESGLLRSRYRVSRVGEQLFIHSAFPTDDKAAVFLGPDTYRFVRFLRTAIDPRAARLVDMGAGTGAGAICSAALLPGTRLTLIDTNPEALRLARISAEAAGIAVETVEGDSLAVAEGDLDLIIANPPFIADDAKRAYRDGGDMLGARVSLTWALEAAERLVEGGALLLYTGSAIVGGRDALREQLERELPLRGCSLTYEEIDPDIFGEQLNSCAYLGVERIAAIGATVRRIPYPAR
jgi:methylase of polypeptide subunit release factors